MPRGPMAATLTADAILQSMSSRRSIALSAALSIVAAACGNTTPATPGPATATATVRPSAATAPTPPACPETPAVAPAVPWWQERVFYEVFVRSFADSDGDGIGDLRGLTEHLDYLNDGDPATRDDLGVTGLWLMPIAESPSYHGYDVVDYRTIEADYGTNDDFKRLIAEARRRGIEIIVDLVMNHSSIDHPWFVDARTAGADHEDWYVWSPTRPPVSGPAGRPVWHQAGDRWYYGYFWEGMPDLNLANPEVSAELDDIARFWLEDQGVAGFRLDAARHLIEDGDVLENTPETMAWLRGFRDRTHATRADALVLGEVWDATSVASRYVRDGSLDLTFDFGLASQMLSAVRFGDAASLAITQAEVSESYPAAGYAAFLTNHDQDRTMDVLGRDWAAARQVATLLLTGAGVPFIYYGEEVGLRGRKPDERIRTPMPWSGEGPGHGFTTGEPWQQPADGVDDANVADQLAADDSLLGHYRALIALRSGHPALGSRGTLVPLEATVKGVYAILRHDPMSGDGIIAVSNLTDEPVADVELSLGSGPLCGSPTASVLYGSDYGPTQPRITRTGGLEPWSAGALDPHEDRILGLAR
jgi:alpha-amylase